MKGEGSSEDGAEALSEADRRALRGSRFASLSPLAPPSRSHPRLAHPGGPIKTNKAAALSKFLERKLKEPDGLSSINPELLERAVKDAKDTLKASTSGASVSGRVVHHVTSFGESEKDIEQHEGKTQDGNEEIKKKKKKKNKNKSKSKKKSADRMPVGSQNVSDETKKKIKKKKLQAVDQGREETDGIKVAKKKK